MNGTAGLPHRLGEARCFFRAKKRGRRPALVGFAPAVTRFSLLPGEARLCHRILYWVHNGSIFLLLFIPFLPFPLGRRRAESCGGIHSRVGGIHSRQLTPVQLRGKIVCIIGALCKAADTLPFISRRIPAGVARCRTVRAGGAPEFYPRPSNVTNDPQIFK